MNEVVLLMGHGSRDPEGVAGFVGLANEVRAAMPHRRVAMSFLEFGGSIVPSIQDAIDRCVERGAERIVAVPVLLLDAGHSSRDMPIEIAEGRRRHPRVDFVLSPPLGIDDAVFEAIEQRAREMDQEGTATPGETAILLAAAGSSNANGNSDLFKIARLIWERNAYGWVETCFVSVTRPDFATGVERCVALGARRIVVVPYFLNTGFLLKRIPQQAPDLRLRYPTVEIDIARQLGTSRKVVELITKRASDLLNSGAERKLQIVALDARLRGAEG